MFDEITQREIEMIMAACISLPNTSGNYVPELVFIVSQMRTRARFTEWRNEVGKGKGKGGKGGGPGHYNCHPGTVIDGNITEPGTPHSPLLPWQG